MSKENSESYIRPTRRQAIATGILTALGTLFASRKPTASAQQNAEVDATNSPYESIAWPDGFSAGTTLVGDIEIYHVTGGNPDGPTVLLWHGFLGNSYSWREVMPLLAADFNVVCPDMRGYGASTHPGVEAAYDGRTLAADFRGLMEQLGHSRYHIIAHDMGAPAALLLAADSPSLVQSLTYVEEPAALPEVLSEKIRYTEEGTHLGGLWWWMMAYAEGMAEAIIVGNERPFVDWFYNNYAVDPSTISEQARRVYVQDFEGSDGIAGWFGVYRSMLTTAEQTAPLAEDRVQTPVLAIGGQSSQGSTIAEQMRQIAREVQEVVVEDCGHFVPEEKPEELVSRFRTFAMNL